LALSRRGCPGATILTTEFALLQNEFPASLHTHHKTQSNLSSIAQSRTIRYWCVRIRMLQEKGESLLIASIMGGAEEQAQGLEILWPAEQRLSGA
jgi:outer membrane PBP1 activator LpoA protein